MAEMKKLSQKSIRLGNAQNPLIDENELWNKERRHMRIVIFRTVLLLEVGRHVVQNSSRYHRLQRV